jgi:hypothetical protein
MVGLADVEVKEARERVRCAIQNSGLQFPHNQRITVNLAPADLPKDSSHEQSAKFSNKEQNSKHVEEEQCVKRNGHHAAIHTYMEFHSGVPLVTARCHRSLWRSGVLWLLESNDRYSDVVDTFTGLRNLRCPIGESPRLIYFAKVPSYA